MIIYKATNILNGKAYVGQTVRSLDVRIREHLRKKDTYFDKALSKYGINSFRFEIIDSAKTVQELNAKEVFWINFFNTFGENGYNMCEGGGNTTGFHHSEHSKKAMSEKKKSAYIGVGNPFYGKHHSEKSCEKMKESRKGRIITTEWRKHISEGSKAKVKVQNIETGEIFNSIKEAATKYNIIPTHISRVCRGKRNKTGGYHWKYV